MRIRLEVRSGGIWYRVKVGVRQPSGWLHYELSDGTNGLARPENWRIVNPKTGRKVSKEV